MGQSYTSWSSKELTILRENAGKITAVEIGKLVNRGPDGVRKMAKKLGLPSFAQKANNPHPKPRKEKPVPELVAPVEPPVEVKAPVVSVFHERCPCCGDPVREWDAHLGKMSEFECRNRAA